jgi:hypothetical protein
MLEMTHNAKNSYIICFLKAYDKEGTDSVSRGQLQGGVMTGKFVLSFIPTNEDPLE